MNVGFLNDAEASRRDVAGVRTGIRNWLSSLRSMLWFEAAEARQWAVAIVLVQLAIGAGMPIVYGFFYSRVTPSMAYYLQTGAPALALIPFGFVMVPKIVSQQKRAGTFEFLWSLPVPRSAQAAARFLLYSVLALPGMALALIVATWRYGGSLSVSPEAVLAAALCAMTAISVGHSLALAVPKPTVADLITDVLNFVVLFFSPIVIPIGQLPGWLADIHRALPFYNIAVVLRVGLTKGPLAGLIVPCLVLVAWMVIGWAMTIQGVSRQG